MGNESGLWKSLRVMFFIVVIFNAVTMVVYLRTQEVHQQYRLSRLQTQIDRELDQRRELSRRMLEQMQKEKLEERQKGWRSPGRSE